MLMRQAARRLRPKLRRVIRRSWFLSRCYYRCRGARLVGRPGQEVWYFAYGANMDDGTFRVRRGIQALKCHSGRIEGYRLRFNLDGRPRGKAAPANLHPDPEAEVWGVLYRITRRACCAWTRQKEYRDAGTAISRLRPKIVMVGVVQAVTYMAQGNEVDGKPSLRYITLLRDGARAHGLPETHIRFLESVEHVQ